MKKINIIIPDNLSDNEEVFEIAKNLQKKLLSGGPDKLMIGSGYQIKELETQINIKRIPAAPHILLHNCSVCNSSFDVSLGKELWNNYGGKPKKFIYCSEDCRDFVINITGIDRTALKKSKLKPVRSY